MTLHADGGYQGAQFQGAAKRVLAKVNAEIVKRCDQTKGFVTSLGALAWLGRRRRLAKDQEWLNRKALALVRLAASRLMPRKL